MKNKTLTALITGAALYLAPIQTDAIPFGLSPTKPITWEKPNDIVEHVGRRVVRHTTYDDFAHNAKCSWDHVPAIHYSLVSIKGDTLDGIITLFRKAGASEESLDGARDGWNKYAKVKVPEDLIFKMGHPGPCSY